jgi:hypothetical protein
VPGFSARMFFSVFRADFARETCKREGGERGKNYMVIFFMTLIIYLIFYRKSCFFYRKSYQRLSAQQVGTSNLGFHIAFGQLETPGDEGVF